MKYNKHMPSNSAIVWASGHFLIREFPDNFEDLSEEQIDTFIEDYICEDYEYHSVGDVYSMIENLAYDAVNNLDRITKEKYT